MRKPLRRISEREAVELVATTAYFTRLFNDLVVRRKIRVIQDYYYEVIFRAGMGVFDEALHDRHTLITEAKRRIAAFDDAAAQGRLLHGETRPFVLLQGGATGGPSRRTR